MTRHLTLILLAGFTLLFLPSCGKETPQGGSQAEGPSEPLSPQRNVVLISIDSLRRDRVGVYGHKARYAPEVPVTPTLDAIAQEGVVFEDAWTTTSWTLPSHMSLMTGLSDRSHGVEIDEFQLDPLRTTLAEAFQARGYRTGGFFSGPYLDGKYGFARGYDTYQSGMLSMEQFTEKVKQQNQALIDAGQKPMSERDIIQMRDRISHWDITSPKIEALAKDFLNEAEEDPFFLFVHFFDAHYDHIPWSMDPGLAQTFDPDYAGPFDGSNWYFDSRVMDSGPPYKRNIGDRDLNHILANYDAEIHWVDRHIGQLVADLKQRGLWENTVIMIVSDHGDEFFEHQSIGHRSTLFAEQCRIPMIMRVPGEADQGQRVAALSRIYDVAPTLLDYSGGLAHRQLQEAEGKSLRSLVDGSESEGRNAFQRIYSGGHRKSRSLNIRDGWRNSRYSVVRQFNYDNESSTPEAKAVKVLRRRSNNSPYLIFDREADPQELYPLEPNDPRFQEAVAAFCQAFEEAEREASKLPVSPLGDRLAAAGSEMENAALDALGYSSTSADGTKSDVLPLLPFPAPCPE